MIINGGCPINAKCANLTPCNQTQNSNFSYATHIYYCFVTFQIYIATFTGHHSCACNAGFNDISQSKNGTLCEPAPTTSSPSTTSPSTASATTAVGTTMVPTTKASVKSDAVSVSLSLEMRTVAWLVFSVLVAFLF